MENSARGISPLHRIYKAKHYIDQNFMNDIKLEDIAKMCYMSVTNLTRTFKLHFNESPHQYLVNTRLNKAKELLRDSDDQLKDIVYYIGFFSDSSFVRLFKKRFGITPGDYRKKIKKLNS